MNATIRFEPILLAGTAKRSSECNRVYKTTTTSAKLMNTSTSVAELPKWNNRQVKEWIRHLDECESCEKQIRVDADDGRKQEFHHRVAEYVHSITNCDTTTNEHIQSEDVHIQSFSRLSHFRDMVPFITFHSLVGIDLMDITQDELISMFYEDCTEGEMSNCPHPCHPNDQKSSTLIFQLYKFICNLRTEQYQKGVLSECNFSDLSSVSTRIH